MLDYNEHMMSSDSLITHLTLKEKTATPTENSKTDIQCQEVETGCEKGGFRFADILTSHLGIPIHSSCAKDSYPQLKGFVFSLEVITLDYLNCIDKSRNRL